MTGTEAMTAFLREILTEPVSPAPVVRNGLQKTSDQMTPKAVEEAGGSQP